MSPRSPEGKLPAAHCARPPVRPGAAPAIPAAADRPGPAAPLPPGTAIPVLQRGVLWLPRPDPGAAPPRVRAVAPGGPDYSLVPLPGAAGWLVRPEPAGDLWLDQNGVQTLIQTGGWEGSARAGGAHAPADADAPADVGGAGAFAGGAAPSARAGGPEPQDASPFAGRLSGRARNLRHPERDAVVLALGAGGVLAAATAPAAGDGRFEMLLPPSLTRSPARQWLTLAIAGSDFVLGGGPFAVGGVARPAGPALLRGPRRPDRMVVGIKISAPNLREAPMWGDYHFACSLAAAFERIDIIARVDTADAWRAASGQEDVMLMLRGRHGLRPDRSKINVLWLISHPERVNAQEYAGYDHIAVASDLYAQELRRQGMAGVSVLHQATDAERFGRKTRTDPPREAACLFVGNSRGEYRTMVKWCLRKGIPLALYGGGWQGILPSGAGSGGAGSGEAGSGPGPLRGTGIGNAELPQLYARHLLLLNDHWDSMRDSGFLSNRLFDGSATGTPILTDPVAGLGQVFGDTITSAGTDEDFCAAVEDCLTRPDIWLERAARARDIVLGAHTFDHRAASLAALFGRIAAGKPA